MASISETLRYLVEHDQEPFLRDLARRVRVSNRGDAEQVIARLEAAYGDLSTLLRAEGGHSRNEWNDLVTLLGGSRRRSLDEIAAELDALATDDAEDPEGDDEGDLDDETDAGDLGFALPDDVFEFDSEKAAKRARDYQHELTSAIERTLGAAAAGAKHRITVATGGGKTRIANDWIWNHAIQRDWRVLWITKDWPLLRQAASDLCQRYRGAARRLGYVGANGKALLGPLAESAKRHVVYSTIHTWQRRQAKDFADARFDAVIIDEQHWGEGKHAYRALQQRYRQSAVFLGLTATPRDGTGYKLIGGEYGYAQLARMGHLAKHRIAEAVRTGVTWSPTRTGTHGDFDRASLSELARSRSRNRRIVDTYVKNRVLFGKTLVFACDVEHAETLRDMFSTAGASAEAVHSGMRAEDQARVVERFRKGTTRVLVNVAMMTHGIDIPDIETVFLARPTASKILFAQMVGRAARLTEGKTHFNLVDFVDNVGAHGDILVSPTTFFGDVEPPPVRSGAYARSPPRPAHEFTPARFEHVPKLPGYEDIQGLDLQPAQTFGIEFELTREDFEHTTPGEWMAVAKKLLDAIPVREKAAKPFAEYHDEGKDHSVWNVEWDGSCGWEVTSRILSGAGGFCEVVDVCRALDEAAAACGLRVDKRTGTHVHLGWNANARWLQRLVRLVAHYESALYTLVAPSRSGNRYCSPLRSSLGKLLSLTTVEEWAAYFSDHERRYLSVNPANLFRGLGTIEVRLHSGTLEGPKILGWLSLWMRILAAAESRRGVPEEEVRLRDLPLEAEPRGDVLTLADDVLAGADRVRHLARRRAVVMERWMEHSKYASLAAQLMTQWSARNPLAADVLRESVAP